MLLAAAPATRAARYCASVNPFLLAFANVVITACAYARWVPPRTGGNLPTTYKGACGAAVWAALVPLPFCVLAAVLAAAVGVGAARLAAGLGAVLVAIVNTPFGLVGSQCVLPWPVINIGASLHLHNSNSQ